MTTKTFSNASNARRAARVELGPEAVPTVDFKVVKTADGRFTWKTVTKKAEQVEQVMLATEDGDLGLVNKNVAQDRAQAEADAQNVTVYLRDPLTDEVVGTVKPTPAMRPSKSSKIDKMIELAPPSAETNGAKRGRKAAGPSGMVAKIIELATRPEGVTRAELNETTNWKGAPWKWLFQNPKRTGYADRWGYSLEVMKRGQSVAYKLTRAA